LVSELGESSIHFLENPDGTKEDPQASPKDRGGRNHPRPRCSSRTYEGGGTRPFRREGKTHGYTWEFFKERIELEFIPKNSDYISRCKLRDLMNASNENLRQYVRAYSELMLEIRQMHGLDRVCHFVMGLPTWAKRKVEENWPTSLTEAIMKVEGLSDVGRGEKFGFKRVESRDCGSS
jgi:hypothetical protein